MHDEQFVDTYSDDIILITEARKRLADSPDGVLADAATTRWLVVFVCGALEGMFKRWAKETQSPSLMEYARSLENREPNEPRIRQLANDLKADGISVDEEILLDFLALVQLRNAIIHNDFRKGTVSLVESRGFGTDTRRFDEKVWNKTMHIYETVMKYVAFSGISGRFNNQGRTK